MSDATPHMIPVQSSNVESIGHDGKAMHVRFKGGSHYVYADGPTDKYHSALGADSVGKFVAEHLKGKHTSRKL